VVDGLELHRQWLAALDLLKRISPPPGSAGALSLLFAPFTNKPSTTDLIDAKAILEPELNVLADAIDAVSDAVVC